MLVAVGYLVLPVLDTGRGYLLVEVTLGPTVVFLDDTCGVH